MVLILLPSFPVSSHDPALPLLPLLPPAFSSLPLPSALRVIFLPLTHLKWHAIGGARDRRIKRKSRAGPCSAYCSPAPFGDPIISFHRVALCTRLFPCLPRTRWPWVVLVTKDRILRLKGILENSTR